MCPDAVQRRTAASPTFHHKTGPSSLRTRGRHPEILCAFCSELAISLCLAKELVFKRRIRLLGCQLLKLRRPLKILSQLLHNPSVCQVRYCHTGSAGETPFLRAFLSSAM